MEQTGIEFNDIGTQYIFCGNAKDYFSGEEMKVRVKHGVVTSFGNAVQYKDWDKIPKKIWLQMINDHKMTHYWKKLQGNLTII